MGKGNRIKRERGPVVSVTHEPRQPRDWPDGHVQVALTGDDSKECIVVTIHGVHHYLHSTTAHALSTRLQQRVAEWNALAKSQGVDGVLEVGRDDKGGSKLFDASKLAGEIEDARSACRQMVRGAMGVFGRDNVLLNDHLPFLGFIERAQAFHQGVVDMVESGNPLGAGTLLRSFAENLAVVYYLRKHPDQLDKMRPGAQQGFSIGKLVAEAEKHLPTFKDLYKRLSDMAHPSGAGAFNTVKVSDEGAFTWQSHPTFRSTDEARGMLKDLGALRQLTEASITQTALAFRSALDGTPRE